MLQREMGVLPSWLTGNRKGSLSLDVASLHTCWRKYVTYSNKVTPFHSASPFGAIFFQLTTGGVVCTFISVHLWMWGACAFVERVKYILFAPHLSF